jgi:oligoribonuclease NrnB/cAMP/cGMP phosphodiesterase (DHH superfamily)
MDGDGVKELMEMGIPLVKQMEQLVEQTIKISKRYITFEGYENVPLVNCPYMLASDVGNEISKDHLFSLSYYDSEDKRIFSMRTANDDIDLSEIAVKYGGGGHAKACGFAVSRQHPLACI